MRVKLVRDKVPLLGRKGEEIKPVNSQIGKVALLVLKLHEEAQEIAENPWDPEEYADIMEVLAELMRLHDVSGDAVSKAAEEKSERLGNFRGGMVLSWPGPGD